MLRSIAKVPLAVALFLSLSSGAAWAGKANDTLVWSTDKELDTADPYYNNLRETFIMGRLVFDSLLYRDPVTFENRPLLATSYKFVDAVTIDFELRDGVVFHDGKKFGADDVVYTFNHVSDPDKGVLTKNSVNWIKKAEKLGERKVRLHLKAPFPAALEYLAGPTPIVPNGHYDDAPEMAGGRKDYGKVMPVGTGPYKLTGFKVGETVAFEINRDYFDSPKGEPSIGKLTFRTIRDPETQIAELLTGGTDWIWDVSKDKAEQLGEMKGITAEQAPTMRVGWLAMDAAGKGGKTPVQDIRVRRAVNHAVNREAIAKNLVGGASVVIHSACFPSQFGCTQDVARYAYDPEKAKRLLAEAGYGDGFDIDIYAHRQREYTEAVIGDLSKVGIRARLKYMQYRALRPLTWSGKAQLAHLYWGSWSINDVSAITSHFFKGGKDDYAHDADVKRWLDLGDTSLDRNKRKQYYEKALRKIADQAYWAPMFTLAKFYVYTEDLDFTPTPDEIPRFYAARWK